MCIMHCLIHYINCYNIYLKSAMCSILCVIYYRVIVKINLYQCHNDDTEPDQKIRNPQNIINMLRFMINTH